MRELIQGSSRVSATAICCESVEKSLWLRIGLEGFERRKPGAAGLRRLSGEFSVSKASRIRVCKKAERHFRGAFQKSLVPECQTPAVSTLKSSWVDGLGFFGSHMQGQRPRLLFPLTPRILTNALIYPRCAPNWQGAGGGALTPRGGVRTRG